MVLQHVEPFDIALVPSIAFVPQEKRSSADFTEIVGLVKGTSNDSERIELDIKLKDLERNICLYSHIYIYIYDIYIYIRLL